MGGAQPLAVTMNGGAALVRRGRPAAHRAPHRDTATSTSAPADLDDALRRARRGARARGAPLSIGLLGNAAEVLPELVRRGVHVDVVTDQTSAHDPLNGYIPAGLTRRAGRDAARARPGGLPARASARARWRTSARSAPCSRRGADAFDYGNALRGLAAEHGAEDAFAYPGFVPAYIRPLFCEGKGPFRWVALSGDPEDIHSTDEAILDLFGDQDHVARWIRLAREKVQFQGLPARICWLGYGERDRAGLRFNEMVASGELPAPIVIGRDHLDAGSVASPERETEAMRDGSDAVADWPILNALLNTACGRQLGVGPPRRRRRHGQVDPRRAGVRGRRHARARRAARRVLTADPGMGVVRHADAGYPEAIEVGARARRARADAGPTDERRASRGAAQVLRPPEDGLPYLRHDRAGELTLEPASLTLPTA